MKKILILGHKGLLGNMVYDYFKSLEKYEVLITDLKWHTTEFKDFVTGSNADCIINCIGIIPQRKPEEELYMTVNYLLPVWLDKLGVHIIHPDTDEPDDTPYGLSKRMARDHIGTNTKIIRTSIMGFEKGTKFSLLEWFLNSEGTINGYTNQFWNGNTTLEWARWAEDIVENWDSYKKITTLANPDCKSKYDILMMLSGLFEKKIEIIPTEAPIPKNNFLTPEVPEHYTNDLLNQLIIMRYFTKR